MAKAAQKQKAKSKQAVDRGQLFRDRAANAYQNIDKSYLDLAESLWEIKHGRREDGTHFFSNWGYEAFNDYVSLELGMPANKANSLSRIWETITTLDLDKGRLDKIGWFKASIIASKLDADNYEELLDIAEKSSTAKLTEEIQTRFGTRGTRSQNALVIRFEAGTTEERTVSEVIGLAKEAFPTDSPASAIANVCLEWMTWKGASPQKLPVEEVIRFLRKTYHGSFTFEPADLNDLEGPSDEELEGIDEDVDLNSVDDYDEDSIGLLSDEDIALMMK